MTDIHLYGVIGQDENTVLNVIQSIESPDEDITVRVASVGGDIYEAIAISNVLKSHRGNVTVIIDSLAASAASVIAAVAGKTFIAPQAEIMVHNPHSFFSGDAEALIKQAGNLNRVAASMAAIYAEKSGYKDADFWLELMDKETWLSAEEAVNIGLADDIYTVDVADSEEIERVHAIAAQAASEYGYKYSSRDEAPGISTNEIEENNMEDFLNVVAQKLGMNAEDGLTQDAVLAALDETLSEHQESNEAVKNSDSFNAEDTSAENVQNSDDSQNFDTDDSNDTNGNSAADSDDDTNDSEDTEAGSTDDSDDSEDTQNAQESEGSEENAAASDNTVVLDRDIFEELKRRAELGAEVAEKQRHDEAEALVAAAISDGKVLAVKKDALVSAALEDFSAMKAHLDSLESGVIPVAEVGRTKISAQDTKTKGVDFAQFFGTPSI